MGMNEEVINPGKQPQRVKARSLGCFWAVLELGLVGASVAKMLGMSQPAVSKAVRRGGNLAADKGYTRSGERKFEIHGVPFSPSLSPEADDHCDLREQGAAYKYSFHTRKWASKQSKWVLLEPKLQIISGLAWSDPVLGCARRLPSDMPWRLQYACWLNPLRTQPSANSSHCSRLRRDRSN